MMYGVSVVGVTDYSLTYVKRVAASGIGPVVQGRSLDMALFLADIRVETEANAAPLVKWHDQVWEAQIDHAKARMLDMSLPRLRQHWYNAIEQNRQ